MRRLCWRVITGCRLTLIRAGFEAVPVKQSGTQLTASEFSATMTMVVEYQ